MAANAVPTLAVAEHFQAVFGKHGPQDILPARLVEVKAAPPLDRVDFHAGNPALDVEQEASVHLHRQNWKNLDSHETATAAQPLLGSSVSNK